MSFPLLADTPDFSTFHPVSTSGGEIRNLFILVLVITGLILALVWGVLAYNLLTAKRWRGPDDPQPAQVYGSMPIETAWTAAPLLIVFVLILLTARGLWGVHKAPAEVHPDAQAMNVMVIGRQWWWEYHYTTSEKKEQGFTTANELHLPASDPGQVRQAVLSLQSADVNHSYWVPRLMGKTDLIPGRVNVLTFHSERPGLYLGQCAEYCGNAHARMLLRVYVDEPKAFEAWQANQMKLAVDDPSARDGRDVFLNLACTNCHAIRGTPAKGTYGPDLTHLMSRDTIAAGILPNTPENIRQWVRYSQLLKGGCLMPEFKLSDQEMDKLVHYLTTLK
jgi:cytochrome c oxidase subunit 2